MRGFQFRPSRQRGTKTTTTMTTMTTTLLTLMTLTLFTSSSSSSSPSKVQIVKDSEDLKDFRIEVLADVSSESRGDVCGRRTGKGDKVQVHYERKLIERNGQLSQMLDSR